MMKDDALFLGSSSNLRPVENMVQMATSGGDKRRLPILHPSRLKEEKKTDLGYIKNLQGYIKELSEENHNLRLKNSELEALLGAAYDEIEEYERALLELSTAYEECSKKEGVHEPPKPKKGRKKQNKADAEEQKDK